MIAEPIEFTIDHDGNYHFANHVQPLKTVIQIEGLPFRWVTIDEMRKRIIIKLDDETVIYDRMAVGLHGEWICILQIGPTSDAD